MSKQDRKYIYYAVAVAVLLVTAHLLYLFSDEIERIGIFGIFLTNIVRSGIYLGIIVVWGISVRRRIIHHQVRQLFTAISFLMAFWMVIRTIKFLLPYESEYAALIRYLWYLYYVPMIFLPLLSFLISLWFGRPENYCLPVWTRPLKVIGILFMVLVLTNDLHKMVFSYHEGETWTDKTAIFMPIYYLIIGWRIAGLLVTIGVIFIRSRVPQSTRRLILPLIPSATLLAYGITYITGVKWMINIFSDITVAECMHVIAILETCLECGLIQANTRYAELFGMLGYPSVIIDDDYNTIYSSDVPIQITKEQMIEAEEDVLELGDGFNVKSMPIKGGRILWAENVVELTRLQRQEEALAEVLAEENDLLWAEIEMKHKKAAVDVRNRLYDSVVREISPQFAEIDRLVSSDYANEEEKNRALKRMCVIGAYIKRRCNLLFINEEHSNIKTDELMLCIRESADYIRLYGAECVLNVTSSGMILTDNAALVYDAFERVVETVLDSLTAMLIHMDFVEKCLVLNVQSECEVRDIDFSGLKVSGMEVSDMEVSDMEISGIEVSNLEISGTEATDTEISASGTSDRKSEMRENKGSITCTYEDGILYVKIKAAAVCGTGGTSGFVS